MLFKIPDQNSPYNTNHVMVVVEGGVVQEVMTYLPSYVFVLDWDEV